MLIKCVRGLSSIFCKPPNGEGSVSSYLTGLSQKGQRQNQASQAFVH
jgi:hypothetical protein